MTILFLSRLFYPHNGGVEKHVLSVGENLAKEGHKVIVITEKLDKNQKDKDKINGIEIYRIPVNSGEKKKKFVIWKWLWRNKSLIKNADIVHAHDVFFWYLPFRLLFPKKNFFVTFHGYETKFPIPKKSVFLRKIGEKLSFGNICVGSYLEKWYGTRADFITYGGTGSSSNKKSLKLKKEGSSVKILFIGRLEEDTGLLVYLKTLEILKSKKFNFEFQSIGDGSMKSNVAQYGKSNGFVENIDDFLEWSDITFSSSYQSILDSLLAGKPVFAVYENPLKEDYLKLSPLSKFIEITNSSEFLAEKIMKNKIDLINIKVGQEFAQKQNWNSITNTYKKLWRI